MVIEMLFAGVCFGITSVYMCVCPSVSSYVSFSPGAQAIFCHLVLMFNNTRLVHSTAY